MISPGFYDAVATTVDTEDGPAYVQFGFTKDGKRQIAITFEILSGEFAGHKIVWFGYFTEKTTARTIQALRYCGFKGDDLAAAMSQPLDQQVSITVKHDEYNGNVRAKVEWVNAPGGGGFKLSAPMKRDDMRKFSAEMKMAVRGIAEATGEKATRGSASTNGAAERGDDPMTDTRGGGGGQQRESFAPDDSDIPFIYQE